jgi:hypothetical protein
LILCGASFGFKGFLMRKVLIHARKENYLMKLSHINEIPHKKEEKGGTKLD